MNIKASWRTSVFGAGGLVTVVGTALSAMFDGNPATNPDWALVVAALMPCLGLLFARDDKVTSEAAGADIPPAGTLPIPTVTPTPDAATKL